MAKKINDFIFAKYLINRVFNSFASQNRHGYGLKGEWLERALAFSLHLLRYPHLAVCRLWPRTVLVGLFLGGAAIEVRAVGHSMGRHAKAKRLQGG